jgi:hypothetical protein
MRVATLVRVLVDIGAALLLCLILTISTVGFLPLGFLTFIVVIILRETLAGDPEGRTPVIDRTWAPYSPPLLPSRRFRRLVPRLQSAGARTIATDVVPGTCQ